MARYRGPRARICRRLEFPVFESDKFSAIRKNYPPSWLFRSTILFVGGRLIISRLK